MDLLPYLCQDQWQEICSWALQNHSLPTGPSKASQRVPERAWPPPHQAASAPCQGLTSEQRAVVPDVMSLVLNFQSLVLKKLLALSSVAVRFFDMNAADILNSSCSNPVYTFSCLFVLVFHCCPPGRGFVSDLIQI